MEKIEQLIDRLQRQHAAGATATDLLATLQLLQAALSLQLSDNHKEAKSITVVMPAPRWNMNAADEPEADENENTRGADEEKMVFELDPFVQQEKEEATPSNGVIIVPPDTHSAYLPERKEVPVEKIPEPKETVPPPAPVQAAPPIPAPVEAVEMKTPVITADQRSLNDLLEKPMDELFTRLHEPIKDLKKAISINDRYQYITNLFSGDESVYDRSIKTINNFNIVSEAEYWIRRELAVKYAWRDNDPLVKEFYQLVSRRFS